MSLNDRGAIQTENQALLYILPSTSESMLFPLVRPAAKAEICTLINIIVMALYETTLIVWDLPTAESPHHTRPAVIVMALYGQ